MNINDKKKWEELSAGLLRAARECDTEAYEDRRPLNMVETTLKTLAYLVKDYESGNREMCQLYASLMFDFLQELQQHQMKFNDEMDRFEELIQGVDLDKNYS